ncbi:hypothetical protein AAFP30_07245 [Gordonia sp. CPCC 205515]|uniref:hypothetical protein n=1 Tax=Gordonia sp. CPCC 205515 TaxID=3140791 RepID=UPI003AF38883
MNTLVLVTLLAVVLVPAVVVVYRAHRAVGDPTPVPLGHLADLAVRGFSVPPRLGPDSDRVDQELFALQFHHRDCG